MNARFFDFDVRSFGSKGIVFIGEKMIVSRRDSGTTNHPYELDLPGGCAEPGETPYETFAREVREELSLRITEHAIHYVRTYPNDMHPDMLTYFPVARLPHDTAIHFGDEGSGYSLMTPEEFLAAPDGWVVLQEYVTDYILWRRNLGAPIVKAPHASV